ncbi:MAG: hypothetical protein LQ350_006826 [Teloschistes chrysophthalmus]|nr:MAG: hypothetical protein LQ350_006826 [Niorma chrysophthalma]
MSTKSPKPPTTLPPTSTLSPLATKTGTHPLTIGEKTCIQVRAHLDTTHGPLTIGSGCVVGEFASVGLNSDKDVDGKDDSGDEGVGKGRGGLEGEEGEGVVIEDHVVIDARVVVEAGSRIGEGTIVELAAGEILPDYTVIYGFNSRRIDRSGPEAARAKAAEALVEVLKKAEMAIKAAQSARKAGN